MDSINSKLLDEFRVNACKAICFKMVSSEEDIDHKESYHPEYTHQIFGESEQIFGFRDLKINIMYTSASLSTYIAISYSAMISSEICKSAIADDVFEILSTAYTYPFTRNLSDFICDVNHDKEFVPHGATRSNYELTLGDKSRAYCINFIEHGMPDFEDFLNYHRRMESFILFFIDGASFISTDDKQWCFYTVYEKHQYDNAALTYSFIGYMTIYKFYAYPSNLRPRVSQMLILPPYRNSGHGTHLLQTFYRDFVPLANVVDVTVEDPSEDFQRLRDFLDCKRCLECPDLMEVLIANDSRSTEKSEVSLFRDTAKQKLKLNRYQSRRVYEILRLYLLPRSLKTTKQFERALGKRVAAYLQRVRPDIMRGSSLLNKANTDSSTKILKNVFNDAADEYFSTQVSDEVKFQLQMYQNTVDKLDHANFAN